jgi:hypothetical protein
MADDTGRTMGVVVVVTVEVVVAARVVDRRDLPFETLQI